MRGYLLDTNTVAYWLDPRHPEHENVLKRIEDLPAGTMLAISAVTLGEIEYGRRVNPRPQPGPPEEFQEFLAERLPYRFPVNDAVAASYGSLRAALFERYAPKRARQGKLRPEQLVDPVTARELGIQENDVWIAAQAIEYNLVLVTHDRMRRVAEVAEGRLSIEDWVAN